MKSISLFRIGFLAALLVCFSATSSEAHSKGYCAMPDKEVTTEVGKIAWSLLSHPMGTCTPFTSAGINYEGCVEWHWDQVKGKHKGVTVYRQCNKSQ